MEETKHTVENKLTILEMELGIANEKIQHLESTITTLRHYLHDLGNLVAGKVGAEQLELFVKQIVLDILKEHGKV